MSYKICATKRDVNTVGKPLQYFTPSQWMVRVSMGNNAGDYDISDTYLLIKDGEVTSLTFNISPINGCVYEGMQVLVGSGTKLSFGTLLQKDAANQCATKLKVLDANCGLTGESAMYASNRLVREEDIVAPSTVSVYYDPRYLTVEEFKTDGISKFPIMADDPGAPERTPGDGLDPLMNKEFAYSAILCTKGNKVKVRQKSTVNSDLVLNSVYAFDNLSAPILELNALGYEGAEFIASETCFITFDLVLQTYRLSAAAPVIDCATQWGITISAYIMPDGDTCYLASSGIDDPKAPMCRPSAEEYMMVPNEAEVNVSLLVNTYETANTTTFILRNLTTNETTTLTLNDDNECIFKMPSSDCRLETNVVIHEESGDTGFEYEDRILTIKSNQLERVIVNGSTYSFYDGVAAVNIPCDESPSALAEVHFGAGIPAVYSIRAYATSQGPVSMPRSQSSPNTTLSLSTDMTLEISYNPVSCKYSALDGKISTLDKNLMWDNDTTITNVTYSPSGYLLATSLSITSSPSDNLFYSKDKLTTVEFYTDRPAFEITRRAFTDCSSLHEVVLPNTNLTIGEQAFDNCRSLSKLELPSGLSTLGNQVFGENAYNAIYTNPSYVATSGYSNAFTFNVDDNYNSSLTELPKFTFEFCKNLEEVYLPASITKIKNGAFHECNNIKHFAAPGLKVIELGAFLKTWVEESYNYNDLLEQGAGLTCKDGTSGIYFYFPYRLTYPNRHVTLIRPDPDKDEYILYKRPVSFPGGGFNCYFNVPITSIADYGFACNDVVNFANPYTIDFNAYSPSSSIKYIGKYAFKDSGAWAVDLHWHNVSYLGEGAFYNCKVLKMVPGFENSPITTILPYTFYNCGGDLYGIGFNTDDPTSVFFKLPSGTKEIQHHAFANCKLLMGILNLAACPIEKIGDYAFENCFKNTHKIWEATGYVAAYIVRTAAELLIGHYSAAGFTGDVGGTGHSVWSVAKTLGFSNHAEGLAEQAVCEIVFGILGEAAAVGDMIYNNVTKDNYPSTLLGAIQSIQRAARTRVYLHLSNTYELGIGTFKGCKYLGGCVFNSKMTKIPDYAFYDCRRLDQLIFVSDGFDITSTSFLPGFNVSPQITHIGKYSFSGCKKLTDISLNDLLKNVVEIDEAAFKNAKILYLYEDQSSIIINSTVNCIQDSALGFNGKIKLCFIAQDPFLKSYNSNMLKGSLKSNVSLLVPEGSKQKYAELLDIPLKLIDECPLNDNWWVNLKEMDYQIPWISN